MVVKADDLLEKHKIPVYADQWEPIIDAALEAKFRKATDRVTVPVPHGSEINEPTVNTLRSRYSAAGWSLDYHPPGFDQREGSWDGYLTLTLGPRKRG